VYGSSSTTNYNININCGSRVASRAAAAGSKALRATASARPTTAGVAVLPNPATADTASNPGDTDATATAANSKAAPESLMVATGPIPAVPAPKLQVYAEGDSEVEQVIGTSDSSSQATKGASP
jgi:hypothetical protein